MCILRSKIKIIELVLFGISTVLVKKKEYICLYELFQEIIFYNKHSPLFEHFEMS